MKRLALFALFAAACGGSQKPADTTGGDTVKDTRTPFEQRRDAACRQIAPKLTACAVEDAKADLDAGKTTPKQFKLDTAPEVQRKNTEEFISKCTGWRDMSSRQVRVLEVCFREETQCDPLRACLANLQPQPRTDAPAATPTPAPAPAP